MRAGRRNLENDSAEIVCFQQTVLQHLPEVIDFEAAHDAPVEFYTVLVWYSCGGRRWGGGFGTCPRRRFVADSDRPATTFRAPATRSCDRRGTRAIQTRRYQSSAARWSSGRGYHIHRRRTKDRTSETMCEHRLRGSQRCREIATRTNRNGNLRASA